MEISNIGIGASLVVVIIGLLSKEALKKLLSNWSDNLSKTQVNILLIAIIAAFALGVIPITAFIEEKTAESQPSQPPQRYKEDAYVDAGKLVIDKSEKWIEDKHRKDSIREANKPQKWVYQIGPAISEKSALFDRYRLVRDLGNVYIFKESRKNYLIVLDKGYGSQSQCMEELDNFKRQMTAIENNITVTNLMSFCSLKQNLVKIENIQERKEPIELPCMECRK